MEQNDSDGLCILPLFIIFNWQSVKIFVSIAVFFDKAKEPLKRL